MRIAAPRVLLLIALWLVVLVELRTALGFFEVQLSVLETAVIGAVTIAAFLLWALWPSDGDEPAS